MIIVLLLVLGLSLGSFVNALVWRLHEQATGSKRKGRGTGKKKAITPADLSIMKGRSMCTHCHHELAPKDLVPVISWLSLRGKCRYCHKQIGSQYPLVELATAALFIVSYIWWPLIFNTMGSVNFGVWLVILTGFVALLVYDLRWLILPNRITYPLILLAALLALANITLFHGGMNLVKDTILSVVIAGGLFWALFEISKGKWIGGGDVKLGLLIGLLVAEPMQAFLMLFTASLIGTVVVLPGMATKRLTASSKVPFGPFLIVAAMAVKLFGAGVISWYRRKFLYY